MPKISLHPSVATEGVYRAHSHHRLNFNRGWIKGGEVWLFLAQNAK